MEKKWKQLDVHQDENGYMYYNLYSEIPYTYKYFIVLVWVVQYQKETLDLFVRHHPTF